MLELDEAPTEDVSFNYQTLTTGTATAGDDFNTAAGNIQFAKGQTVATLSVTVNADTTFETNETVLVRFSGSKLKDAVTATGTITNDDVDPSLTGQSYTLISGTDNIAAAGGNDSIAGPVTNSANTFTALDKIDGGAGDDTLTVAFSGTYATPGGVSVKNVETFSLSGSGAVTLDTTGNFDGLKNLNVTGIGAMTVTSSPSVATIVTNTTPAGAATNVDGGSSLNLNVTGSAAAADAITVGAVVPPTGDVTVNLSSALTNATGAAISSTGGKVASVASSMRNTATTNTATQGNITITGTTDTTSVSVKQSAPLTVVVAAGATANETDALAAVGGVGTGTVTIADKNGTSGTVKNTLSSVSLTNFGNTTITSSAIDTLTLSGTGKLAYQGTDIKMGTIGITDNAAVPYSKTLALNLNGGYTGIITANNYETINVTQTAASRIESIVDGSLGTINVSGTGQFRLDTIPATTKTLAVSGDAGFRGDISGTRLTGFDGSTSKGSDYITLNAATQTFTGGAGNDTVVVGAAPTKALNGGDGTDTFQFTAAGALLSTTSGPNVTGFETLSAAGASGTIDLANLTNSKFTQLSNANATGGTLTFDNVTKGTPLTITTATTAKTATVTTTAGTTIYQTSSYTGASESVTVTLKGIPGPTNTSAGTTGITFDGLNLRDQTGSIGIGTVNLVSDASVGGGVHTITTLTDPNLSVLNISGTGGVVITGHTNSQGSIAISDTHTGSGASKITTLTAANLASLQYSGSVAFGIDTLAANTAATITVTNANTSPSYGQLTIGAWTNATATKVFLNGAVATTATFANAAFDKLVGNTNDSNNSLTIAGAGAKTITLGNGNNVVVSGAGSDTITLGTGASTVTGAAGGDTITFGAGHTGTASIVYSATGQTATATITSGSTVVSAAAGYDIVSGLRAGDTINLTALGATYTAAATAISTSIISTAVGTAGDIGIVRGNWNPVTGYFTTSSTGVDSLVQWDSNGTTALGNVESIVLVGFVNTASTATALGTITLA